jgi:hypothetical protein
MAIAFPQSLTPILGADGLPIIGAKLYFFNAGTLSPRTAYVDPQRTQPHTFPIIVNGLIPPIYLLPGAYKFYATDASGALVPGYAMDFVDTPLSLDVNGTLQVGQGGTGGTDAATARAGISAASLSDISGFTASLNARLPLAGGTMSGAIVGLTPTLGTHLARKDYVDNMAARVGHSFHYIGGTLPARYNATAAQTEALFLDGRAISRTVFALLFAELSTYYGAGDGVSTFNIPDTRGYFNRNLNNGAGAPDASRNVPGSFQAAGIADHVHATPATFNAASGATGLPGGSQTGAYTLSGTGETRPINLAFWHCVYTGLPKP